MADKLFERRSFLKKAAAGALAAPLLPSLNALAADEPKKTGTTAKAKTATVQAPPKAMLNVRDYGAKGDGTTKDTDALQQTIERCSMLGGGEVIVPEGNYLTGALSLLSNVTLRLQEGAVLNGSPDVKTDYPLRQVRWEGHFMKAYIGLISATGAENIAVIGPGKIIATPAIKGRLERPSGMRLPPLLEFIECKNVNVENLYTEQTGMWSIHPLYCENVTFKNVTVKSGADGIDVDSCKHVVIDGCDFDTTDDCISLKSGRGIEGYTIARPTEDIKISNCTFRDKVWACIGIGSETSGGIRGVHVDKCKCLGAGTFAIYIKSRPGRGAFIEDIWMNDLEVSGAKLGFLRFNILDSGIADPPNLVPGLEGIPTIRNWNFNNIKVTDEPTLVDGVGIHPDKPLEGLTLSNVTGNCTKGIALANIKNAKLSNIKVTGFTGPLLSTYNVTGTGLSGAAKLEAAKLPAPVPPRSEPYKLN